MATFFKRPGGWQAKIRKKGFPAQSRTFDTRAEAEAWASVIESEMVRGVFVSRDAAESTTISDLFDQYVREVLPAKRSQQQVKSAIGGIKKSLGAYTLATLTPQVLAEYRDVRLKKVGPQTVRHDLSVISRVFNHALREWSYHVPHGNPVKQIRLPSPPRGRDRRLKRRPDELKKLLDAAREYEQQPKNTGEITALIEVAVETAMRRGELASLTVDQIDVKKRVVQLHQTKNGDARTVPLSTRAVQVFKTLAKKAAADAKLDKAKSTKKTVVFGMRPDSITQAFTRICERAGVVDLTFHDLRHEATSRLFERGFNPIEVASITGHKELKMLRRYTHLRAEDLAKRLR